MSKILAVAGETSGDILGASILNHLPNKSAISLVGVGGYALAEQGQKQFFDCHDLAVRGYVEALPAIFRVLKIRHFLKKYLIKNTPQLYLGIDAADFNLHIEQFACRYTKVAHIISPSVWAWRADRIQKIKKSVNHLFCIFPFEPEIYLPHGVSASFIGHPLANQIHTKWHEHPRNNSIAILPGSRRQEIQSLLPLFLEAALYLIAEGVENVYLPVANQIVAPLINDIIQNYTENLQQKKTLQAHLKIVDSMEKALIHSQAALVASGTASLEVALYGTPMVVAYQIPKLTAFLMKRQALINCVSLPNILQQKMHKNPQFIAVPEYLQEINPKYLARDIIKLIKGDDLRIKVREINYLKISPEVQITNRFIQKDIFKSIHQNLQSVESVDGVLTNIGLKNAGTILHDLCQN